MRGEYNVKKQKGIHFYINIINFNSIISDEESNTGEVTHAIHALDTYFTSIEKYGKRLYPRTFVVEKITGSRLHLYVLDELMSAFEVVKNISAYAYRLAGLINKDIPKYKTLNDFYINVGAAYGKFYEFEFNDNTGFSEITTVGYAANFAAKLQALSGYSMISISEDIYDQLTIDEKERFDKIDEKSIEKYKQDKYYTKQLVYLKESISITDADMQTVKEYANSDDLGDIEFTNVRNTLNFKDLKKTQCKKLLGIPVFADVRDFTSQFKDDDSNLEEMALKTQNILASMYKVSTSNGGVHVQFQGDRELSLYHNVPGQTVNGVFQAEKTCFKSAVLAAMRMIDVVKNNDVHIGVGADYGRIFATKIGARGEKDNILLGETIIHADDMEDKKADKDQIAITTAVYDGLIKEDEYLARQFKQVNDYYVATIGYQQYMRNVAFKQQSENTSQNKYNGAWGEL